LTKVSGDPGML